MVTLQDALELGVELTQRIKSKRIKGSRKAELKHFQKSFADLLRENYLLNDKTTKHPVVLTDYCRTMYFTIYRLLHGNKKHSEHEKIKRHESVLAEMLPFERVRIGRHVD